MLKNLPVFLIVFSGLLSVKWAVVHNEIETALEVLCSSKLNFQILEMNFQNERTVSCIISISLHVQKMRGFIRKEGLTYKISYLIRQPLDGVYVDEAARVLRYLKLATSYMC